MDCDREAMVNMGIDRQGKASVPPAAGSMRGDCRRRPDALRTALVRSVADRCSTEGPRPLKRRPILLTALVCVTVLTSSVGLRPSVAHASVDQAVVGSDTVAEALDEVRGDLVEDPRAGVPAGLATTAEGLVAEAVTVQVDIPDAASDGIRMSAGDFTLQIGLPHADTAGPSEHLPNGSTAYPSGTSSANAVIPTGDGVQLLSVITSADAAETFAYDLTMPAGHHLEATVDGGARIIDGEGVVKVEFEPAWAQDAAGVDVPTRYCVVGDTLIQTVDHREVAGVSYPVVADPLPVVVIVISAAALIVVAAAALGVATWIVVSWWNTCRAQNRYAQLSTIKGFTARCVR